MDEKQKLTEDNGNHNKTKRNNMECEGDAIVDRTMCFHGGGKTRKEPNVHKRRHRGVGRQGKTIVEKKKKGIVFP